MPKTKEQEKKPSQEQQLKPLILDALWERLGKPADLEQVKVVHLFSDQWRVNIYRRSKPEQHKIGLRRSEAPLIQPSKLTDSFLLRVSPEGGIIAAYDGNKVVEIERKY